MKNTFLIIGASLLAVVNVIAETEVEKEVKQLILDNNAYALKNLEDQAKMISKEGSLEFWSSGGLLQSIQQNTKVVSLTLIICIQSISKLLKSMRLLPLPCITSKEITKTKEVKIMLII